MQAYVNGDPVTKIEAEHGVDRSTLARMVKRAQHADGTVWGYRALVPHVRVKAYEGAVPPRALVHTKAGNSGAFAKLLQRHRALEVHLRHELSSRQVQFKGSGEGASLFNFKPVLRHIPEAGAVCGNSARTDLCGG